MGIGFKSAILRKDAARRSAPCPAERSSTRPRAGAHGHRALRPGVLAGAAADPAQLPHPGGHPGARGPRGAGPALAAVTCEEQKRIALETLDAVGVKAVPIRVDSEGYYQRVRAQVRELVDVVEDPSRIFEVGLRAATCLEQHELALRACKEAGVTRTSNVEGARKLGMIPVGTMGHEHVQRYGSDEAAFRAMRERRPQRSSYLLDTYDTLASGLPAAFRLIREEPGRGDSIRFDSGNKKLQYLYAVTQARDLGIRPVNILEDGLDAQAHSRVRGAAPPGGLGALRPVLRLRRPHRRAPHGVPVHAGPRGRRVQAVAHGRARRR